MSENVFVGADSFRRLLLGAAGGYELQGYHEAAEAVMHVVDALDELTTGGKGEGPSGRRPGGHGGRGNHSALLREAPEGGLLRKLHLQQRQQRTALPALWQPDGLGWIRRKRKWLKEESLILARSWKISKRN